MREREREREKRKGKRAEELCEETTCDGCQTRSCRDSQQHHRIQSVHTKPIKKQGFFLDLIRITVWRNATELTHPHGFDNNNNKSQHVSLVATQSKKRVVLGRKRARRRELIYTPIPRSGCKNAIFMKIQYGWM